MTMPILPLSLIFLSISVCCADVYIKNEKCRSCQFLVETVVVGLKRTERSHFAGGDTDWEERNLGKYATSETRLVEVMEGVCKKKSLSNSDHYSGISDLEFKCSAILEEHEELVEEYYHKHQSQNMTEWICMEHLKLCCPTGHFGADCSPCPAVKDGAPACFARGTCHGDGSRQGTGKCKCETGYVGLQCRHCDSDYFESERTENAVTCNKCFVACTGGCTGEGPKGCRKCRSGWTQTEEDGCVDVDECASTEPRCTSDNERCVNTEGSFVCECFEGFKKEDGKCVIDVEASSESSWFRLDLGLRVLSMTSLCGIVTLVVMRRSIFLSILTAIAVVAMVWIELNVNPSSVPDVSNDLLEATQKMMGL